MRARRRGGSSTATRRGRRERRGVAVGKRIRRAIQDKGIDPQLVLCSSAVRAVQTWEAIHTGIPDGRRVGIEPELYAASAESLLERLRGVPNEVDAVLAIAHNAGIGDISVGLAGTGDADTLERMQAKYATGGRATLMFDGRRLLLGWAGAQLVEFVVPRDLPG